MPSYLQNDKTKKKKDENVILIKKEDKNKVLIILLDGIVEYRFKDPVLFSVKIIKNDMLAEDIQGKKCFIKSTKQYDPIIEETYIRIHQQLVFNIPIQSIINQFP